MTVNVTNTLYALGTIYFTATDFTMLAACQSTIGDGKLRDRCVIHRFECRHINPRALRFFAERHVDLAQ